MKKHILIIVSLLLGVQLCFAAGALADPVQLTGTVTANTGNMFVEGYNTLFFSELKSGDKVTIGDETTEYTVDTVFTDNILSLV